MPVGQSLRPAWELQPAAAVAPPTRTSHTAEIHELFVDMHELCADIEQALASCWSVLSGPNQRQKQAEDAPQPANATGCCRRLRAIARSMAQLHAQQQRWYAATIAECSRKERLASQAAADKALSRQSTLEADATQRTTVLQERLDDAIAKHQNDEQLIAQLQQQLREAQAAGSRDSQAAREAQAQLEREQATREDAQRERDDVNEKLAAVQQQLDAVLLQQTQQQARADTAETAASTAQAEADEAKLAAQQAAQELEDARNSHEKAAQAAAAQQAKMEARLGELADACNKSLVASAAGGSELLERTRTLISRIARSMPAALAQRLEQGLLQCKVDADLWYSRVLSAAHHARTQDITKLLEQPGQNSLAQQTASVEGGLALSSSAATTVTASAVPSAECVKEVPSASTQVPAEQKQTTSAASAVDAAPSLSIRADSASILSDSSSVRLLRRALEHDLEEQQEWEESSNDSAGTAHSAQRPNEKFRTMVARPSAFIRQLDAYLSVDGILVEKGN